MIPTWLVLLSEYLAFDIISFISSTVGGLSLCSFWPKHFWDEVRGPENIGTLRCHRLNKRFGLVKLSFDFREIYCSPEPNFHFSVISFSVISDQDNYIVSCQNSTIWHSGKAVLPSPPAWNNIRRSAGSQTKGGLIKLEAPRSPLPVESFDLI